MATYVEMRTDGFAANRGLIVENSALDFDMVRRPLRGVEIKDDTYAIIKVIRSDGADIPLVDAGSSPGARGHSLLDKDYYPAEGMTFNYANFIAQSVVDSRAEKSQIVETFGEPYIFFYGEKPRILQVTGLLMNTLDFNWKNEFWYNYENYLRGTKLVSLDARVYFYFDDQIVEGYILDAQAVHQAELPYHVPFQFTMFVTAHTYLGMISNDSMYPISANVEIPAQDLTSTQFFNDTISKLRDRKDNLRPNQLMSTTLAVRQAAEQASKVALNTNTISGAIIKGLSQYEATVNAFLNNVKTYFYGRRMVVPKGLLGAEENVGRSTMANQATLPGEAPTRDLPLRSKIYDNVDEYIGDANVSSYDVNAAVTLKLSPEDMEKKLRLQLAKMGVDVSDPTILQNWRSGLTHTLTKTADAIDFTAGVALFGTGAVVNKAKQTYDLVKSIPGSLADTAKGLGGVAKTAVIP